MNFGSGHTFAINPHNNDEVILGHATTMKKFNLKSILSRGNRTASAANTQTTPLTVNEIVGFKGRSTKQLHEGMIATGVTPSQEVTDIVSKEKANKTRRWVLVALILLVMNVFLYFTRLGAEYILENGKFWSTVFSVGAMGFVIATGFKFLPRRIRFVVIFLELAAMSYNAYVMPGYFGKASIGTQAEEMIANYTNTANKTMEEIGAFYTLNNTVHKNAKNIAKVEKERDGEGVVYESATNIAGKFDSSLAMPAMITAPTINKNFTSLAQLNKELLKAQATVATQVRKEMQKAEGIRSAAEGTIPQVTQIENIPGLSLNQKSNAIALHVDIEKLSKAKFSYDYTPKKLAKSELRIDGFLRVLPFILDLFIVALIGWLMMITYSSDKQSTKGHG